MYLRTLLFAFLIALPSLGIAQELRLVDSNQTTIDTNVYRAYYGTLSGEPHVFSFSASSDVFPVKAFILVPDIEGVRTDISAAMFSKVHPEDPFITIDGSAIEWQRFYDTAGRDTYLAGPVLEATIPKGDYEIRIWSSNNDSQYVLIVQGSDALSLEQITSRFNTLPTIKSEFFGKSASEAYLTPLLLWPIFSILVLLGVVLLLIIILRRMSASSKAPPFAGRT